MGLFYFYFFISGFRHSLNPKEPHQSDQTFAFPKKSLSRKPSAPSSINKLPACSWQPDGSLILEGGDSVLLRNYSSWARLPGEPRCLPPGVSSSRRCRSQRSISPAASPPGGGWGAATGSGAELEPCYKRSQGICGSGTRGITSRGPFWLAALSRRAWCRLRRPQIISTSLPVPGQSKS